MSEKYKEDDDGSSSSSEPLLGPNYKDRKASMIKHFIFLGIWIVLFGLEFIYRQPLFDKSIELQVQLQPKITDAGVAVFEALSIYGNGPPYFIGFAIMYNWFSRGRAFYYICFLSAVGYLMNVTKMAYHEPRPFMVNSDIKVYGCTAEYGNPSGHSLFAAGGHLFIFLDICHARKGYKFSRPIYYVLLFLTISLSFLVGFARFYVGVHTIN